MNAHAEVCLLDFGGGCEIPPPKLKECWKIAQASTRQLCKFLEHTLQEADEKAQQQRLEKLKRQQDGGSAGAVTHPEPITPYFEQSKSSDVEVDIDVVQIAEVERKAEEAYRQQALDYSRGHIASKVREDKKNDGPSSEQKGKSLLAAMLKSANQADKEETASDNQDSSHMNEQHEPDLANTTATLSDQMDSTTLHNNARRIGDREKKPVSMDLDDDENEEAPTMLKNEFAHVTLTVEERTQENSKTSTANEEAMDFSMAITKKKKKKKAKKKK